MTRPLERALLALAASAALVVGACAPKNATEAEAAGNVAWLAEHPTGEAVAALGRLADGEPRALAAIEARPPDDVNVYIAAWSAVTRGAAWGAALLRQGLADATRAELAAGAMGRKDPRLEPFIADLEAATLRLGAGARGGAIAAVLASVGPAGRPAVERRLADGKTRGVMCDALRLPDASPSARAVLLEAPPDSRDHGSCVNAVVELAISDRAVFDWVATHGEPGLVGAVSKSKLPCVQLAVMWRRALAERPVEAHAAMLVPLRESIRRCTTELDPTLAELLASDARARGPILRAIDPYGLELSSMKETCAALRAGHARYEPTLDRRRAADALDHGCKFVR